MCNDPVVLNVPALLQKLHQASEQLVRAVCADRGMSSGDTETIVAICWAESGMNPGAVHHNADGSTDYGIAQFNDTWWIGPLKAFPSSDFVLQHPEACISKMCDIVRAEGERGFRYWATYNTGAYMRYLPGSKVATA